MEGLSVLDHRIEMNSELKPLEQAPTIDAGFVSFVVGTMGKQETFFFGRNDVEVQEKKKEREVKEERVECTKKNSESKKWQKV